MGSTFKIWPFGIVMTAVISIDVIALGLIAALYLS